MGNGPHQKYPMKSGVYCLEMVATNYPLVLSPCQHSHNKKKKKKRDEPTRIGSVLFPQTLLPTLCFGTLQPHVDLQKCKNLNAYT